MKRNQLLVTFTRKSEYYLHIRLRVTKLLVLVSWYLGANILMVTDAGVREHATGRRFPECIVHDALVSALVL